MTDVRFAFPHALAVLLALSIPTSSAAARKEAPVVEAPARPADPAFFAILGSAAPSDRVVKLSSMLRAASLPADAAQVAADLPLFAVLRESGAPGSVKYEASDIALDVVTINYARVRIEHAHVVLAPSADGHSCRFEVSGAPLGGATKFEASGTVEWAAGPAGGDKLDVVFRLDDAPVETLRTLFPNRIDPSFLGLLDVHGNASGVVGETTSEEAPATPLKGDVEASLDWQAVGRTAPFEIATQFSLDDRMVRLRDGHLRWQGLELALKGWFDPAPTGDYELAAGFTDVDTQKVATDWNVPEAWRPDSKLSGTITLKGKPGGGLMRYEASAPGIVVPAIDGYAIRVDAPKFQGSLVAINADIAVSVRGTNIRVGEYKLDQMPVGIRWWHDQLTASTSNTQLWGGENDGSASYKVATDPEFTASGRVKNAKVAEMLAGTVPWLGVDADGSASLAFTFGQKIDRTPYLSAHASLTTGRLGGIDLFARTLEALAAADPALALPDVAALAPHPRSGTGTRVDRLFFEMDKQADAFELGGLLLRAGDFQLDGDGRYARADGLHLDATVSIPAAISSRWIASAPWLASLRSGTEAFYVPVVVGGTPAAPTLALAPDYVDLLARAKRGEALVAPAVRKVKHVGADNLAAIPADPNTSEQ